MIGQDEMSGMMAERHWRRAGFRETAAAKDAELPSPRIS